MPQPARPDRSFSSVASAALAALVLAACSGPKGRLPDTQGDAGLASDPNRDGDGDGYTPAQGDCNDRDATVYPGAMETCDGRDHNCNGVIDDICDDDHDGYATCPSTPCPDVMADNIPGGDCNDQDPLINPGALEVTDNHIDDNCNGQIDEVTPCNNANLPKTDSRGLAAAAELCDPWVIQATVNKDADKRAHDLKKDYGAYLPKQGGSFLVLSTGIAADEDDPGYVLPQPGTEFTNEDPNPDPMQNGGNCGNQTADPATVNDYVELKLVLKVPTNVKSFSFNFNFMSAEYPEFVGTEFNDKFLVELDSKAFKGNISFDKKNNPITVNAGFFDVCDTAPICSGSKTNTCSQPVTQLNGTGYELPDFGGGAIGGGTGWLTTKSPVQPGETATLRFIIFDEGDHIYDSVVIVDNFQWEVDAAAGGPVTIQ
jgi:hypothetical protein